jgi:hypothetical protein
MTADELLEAKERLPEYVSQKPANLGMRSQYSIRLSVGAQRAGASPFSSSSSASFFQRPNEAGDRPRRHAIPVDCDKHCRTDHGRRGVPTHVPEPHADVTDRQHERQSRVPSG